MSTYAGPVIVWSILIFLGSIFLVGLSFYQAKKRKEDWSPKLHHFVLLVISNVMFFVGYRMYLRSEEPNVKRNEAIHAKTEPLSLSSQGVFKQVSTGSYASVIKDTMTGCEFFVSNSDGRIIPRPDSTGKQICKR